LLEFMHSTMVQDGVVLLFMLDVICVVSEIVIESSKHDGHDLPAHVEEALHQMSFVILCAFMIEIGLYIVAKGLEYFTEPLEVLDLIVVSGSLYQDIYFHEATGRLLILFRLWRLARICHGVWSAQNEFTERKVLLPRWRPCLGRIHRRDECPLHCMLLVGAAS